MQAILAAVVLWVLAIVTLTAGDGNRSITGPIKGADFQYFYTIGSLARTHHAETLYDFGALHRAQVALVPESESVNYVPVYPPQTALIAHHAVRLLHRAACRPACCSCCR